VKSDSSVNSALKLNQSPWSRFECYPLWEVSSHLEFSITLSSNDLVPEFKYSKKQELLYQLIRYLHKVEGLGYRKISYKLNEWGIKTPRGKKWYPQSVHSVLKRRNQRDNRIEKQRKINYPIETGKFSLVYKPFF
jgi:hypothetical protein